MSKQSQAEPTRKGIGALMLFFIIAFAVFLITVISVVGFGIGAYNDLVQKDVSVEQKWGSVQTAYERRADLIPNLVETVRGSSEFEKETLTQIAMWRGGIRNAANPGELQQIDSQMTTFISGLLGRVEAYPTLKSSEHFRALMDELAGTENRIKWERDEYNNAIKEYKLTVRSFPETIIAGMFGFEVDKWEMFEASEEAQEAPVVSFR